MKRVAALLRWGRALPLLACGAAFAQTFGGGAMVEAPFSEWASPQGVVRAFQRACVSSGGEAAAAVDWALSEGFMPADLMHGNLEGLLSGQPGSVLVAPGTRGQVLLAAAQGRQCTVWADAMAGPAVRLAMAEMMGRLSAPGARVQLQVDRNIERAGAWRNQMQWRYRAAGAPQEQALGAVTTLIDTPGTQALHAAPLPINPPAFEPDGVPVR